MSKSVEGNCGLPISHETCKELVSPSCPYNKEKLKIKNHTQILQRMQVARPDIASSIKEICEFRESRFNGSRRQSQGRKTYTNWWVAGGSVQMSWRGKVSRQFSLQGLPCFCWFYLPVPHQVLRVKSKEKSSVSGGREGWGLFEICPSFLFFSQNPARWRHYLPEFPWFRGRETPRYTSL